MRYSLGRFQSLAVCLWTRLSQNRPSAHDVPSYLEGPSVGHMALSLGYGPSVGSGPAAETKTPSSVAFIQEVFLPFFPPNLSVPLCKQSSTSSCTHLTPHPSDRAHSAGRVWRGATSVGFMFQRNRTPQWTSRLFWAPQSCVTSHPVAFMPCEVQWTEPGNIYSSLVFVNSSDWKQHITHSKELSANKGED